MIELTEENEAILRGQLQRELDCMVRDLAIVSSAMYRKDYYTVREALMRISQVSITANPRAALLASTLSIPVTLPAAKDTYGPRPYLQSLKALEGRN